MHDAPNDEKLISSGPALHSRRLRILNPQPSSLLNFLARHPSYSPLPPMPTALAEREPATISQSEVLPKSVKVEPDVHVDVKQPGGDLLEIKQSLPSLAIGRRREVVAVHLILAQSVEAQVDPWRRGLGFRRREAGRHGGLVAQLDEPARKEAQHVPVPAGWVILVRRGKEEGSADAFDEVCSSCVSSRYDLVSLLCHIRLGHCAAVGRLEGKGAAICKVDEVSAREVL